MRENRTYGSEGGEAQANASFLPLFCEYINELNGFNFSYVRIFLM